MEKSKSTPNQGEISKEKPESMCPPRKRKYFRELMHEDSANRSDKSYLAKLLNKPSISENKSQDTSQDCSLNYTEKILEQDNATTKNVAWESFLHEIYRKSSPGQSSNKLLNLYVNPSEDPMNYLDRIKESSHSNVPFTSTSRSSARSDTSVHAMEGALANDTGTRLRDSHRPAIYHTNKDSLTTGLLSAQGSIPVTNTCTPLTFRVHDGRRRSHDNAEDIGSLTNALDLTVGKKDKSSLQADLKNDRKNLLEKTMEIQLAQDNPEMEGMLMDTMDKVQCRGDQTLAFAGQATRRRSADEAGIGTSGFCHCSRDGCNSLRDPCLCLSSNTDQCTCSRVKGVSNKVKLTLSSFLRRNGKSNIPAAKVCSSVQNRGQTEGHVSLASMAEYFIEVALRKANQEKKTRPNNNIQEVFKK